MFIDIAKRAYDHSFKIDPAIRSLLDTDFYKFLMLQLIWKKHRHVPVTMSVKNRSPKVLLATEIAEGDLRAQLDHVRTLRFTKSELIWLSGNTFYGKKGIFEPEFIDFLSTYQLPGYSLDIVNGQYRLDFEGDWADVTLWEIYALEIINWLRSRATLASMDRIEIDILYARAKNKVWEKIMKLQQLDGLNITDFGTRRRHGYLWQEWVNLAMMEGLGDKFTGTSNAYIAFKLGLEAKGTNAHELPMVYAALAGDDDEKLAASPYAVLQDWEEMYDGALLMKLPDTFGTTQFLERAPDWVAEWTGARADSKDPAIAGEEIIDWYKQRGKDPKSKLLLLTDGLDVDDIVKLHKQYYGRIRLGFGWGTKLTNDFEGCLPKGGHALDPISLVCKVTKAAGRSAVKLSDNVAKATGSPSEIERYKRVFGVEGIGERQLFV